MQPLQLVLFQPWSFVFSVLKNVVCNSKKLMHNFKEN